MAKFGNENYRDYEYTGKEKYTNDIGKNFIEPAANNKETAKNTFDTVVS